MPTYVSTRINKDNGRIVNAVRMDLLYSIFYVIQSVSFYQIRERERAMIATITDMNPNMLRRIYEEMFDDKIVNYGRLYVAEVVATELYTLYKDRRYFDVWNKFRYEALHIVSDAIGQ